MDKQEQFQHDHDLLIILKTKLDILIQSVDKLTERNCPMSIENDIRLTNIERAKKYWAGAVVVFGAAAASPLFVKLWEVFTTV